MAITSFVVAGDRITSDCQPRQRGYREYLIIHHTATTSLSGALAIMQPGDSRQVSANWVLGVDGRFWRVVPEHLRAWTSASWLDDIATTVETVNESGSPTWGISDDSIYALAYLAVRLFREGHLKELSRRYVIGHNEVSKYAPGTSYATACPGPDMELDRVVALAQQIYAGQTVLNPTKGITMRYLHDTERGGRGTVGEFSFTPYTPEVHGSLNLAYQEAASKAFNGIEVGRLTYDVARQDALNRRAELLADIKASAATVEIDAVAFKAAVKEAVDEAFADDTVDNDTIDVAAIVKGVADELYGRLAS